MRTDTGNLRVRRRWAVVILSLIALSIVIVFGFAAMSATCEPAFQDEFEGRTLDTRKWNVQYPSGRTELQYYAPDAFHVEDGVLRIEAKRAKREAYDYASGVITTLGTFSQTYGYFEIRAKVPHGKGLWPAFWLMPADRTVWPPEIDVFEILGHDTHTVYMSNHWERPDGEHKRQTESFTGPDFSEDFHTFGVAWKPSEIIWYVDDVERARSRRKVSAEPMFVLANLAVGGDWPGVPDATTNFPSYFEIDYIRVYDRRPAALSLSAHPAVCH